MPPNRFLHPRPPISPPAPQYAASGTLEGPLLGRTLPGGIPALDALLLVTAAAHWAAFDGTRQGLFMAGLTAVAGPAVEITLISLGLYSYAHPAFLGVPTWIPWVCAQMGMECTLRALRLLAMVLPCVTPLPLQPLPLQVYFCGGPAVGCLGRKVSSALLARRRQARQR